MKLYFNRAYTRAISLALLTVITSILVLSIPLSLSIPSKAEAAVTYTQLTVQNLGDFIIEPAKIEVFGNPGDTISRSISVTSRIQGVTKFKIELEDFVGTDETQQTTSQQSPIQLLRDDSSPYSIKNGITPDAETFSVSYGQKATIPFTIKIPQNAAPGGFYTAVLVSNGPTKDEQTPDATGAKTISRAGALLFVRVNGDANESGSVDDFAITPSRLIYEPGALKFQILFSNNGNVHLAPYGSVSVKNFLGNDIGSVPIDAYYSLPLSKRYRSVDYGTEGMFGRYTAVLKLNKSYKNPNATNTIETRTITFWIIPFKLVVGLFIGLLVIILAIMYVLRNFDIRKK